MKRTIVKQYNSDYQGKEARIEVIEGGFIVHLPFPYGNNPGGLGRKVVKNFTTAYKDIAEAFGLTKTDWGDPA
jgi:hypothetical protein